MVNSLQDFDAKYGTSSWAPSSNPAAMAHMAPSVKPTTTPNMMNVPGQILGMAGALGGAVVHSTIDPFVHLATNAYNSIHVANKANDINQRGQAASDQVMKLHQQYAHGQISKQQFHDALTGMNGQYDKLSQESQKNVKDAGNVKSSGQMSGDAAQAILTALTLGSGALAKGSVSAVLGAGKLAKVAEGTGAAAKAAQVAGKVVGATGKAVEGTLGVGTQLGTKSVIGAPTTIAGKMIRNAAVVQPSASMVPKTVNDVKKGDAGAIAGDAAILATPAILKGAGMVAKGAKGLIQDSQGLHDMVQFKGGQTINDALKEIKAQADQLGTKKAQNAYQKAVDTARVWQDHALADSHGDVKLAAQKLIARYGGEAETGGINATQALQDEAKYQKSFAQMRKDAAAGKVGMYDKGAEGGVKTLSPEEIAKTGLGRVSQEEMNSVSARFPQNGTKEDFATVVDQLDKEGAFRDNLTLRGQVRSAVANSTDYASLRRNLKDIQTTTPLARAVTSGSQTLDELGADAPKAGFEDARYGNHHAIVGENVTPVNPVKATAELVQGKKAPLGAIGRTLDKVGLGLGDNSKAVFNNIQEDAIKRIENIGLSNKEITGKQALSALNKVATQKKLVDYRQLRPTEIAEALDITKSEARQVRTSLKDAYLHAEGRSMGDKAQDWNIRHNPGAAGYARIQNTLRYQTPWFKAQQGIEAHTLGQVVAPGRLRSDKELTPIKAEMKKAGIFADINSTTAGRDTLGGGIHQELLASEQNALARVVAQTAEDRGIAPAELMNDRAVRETLRSIVGYPSQGVLSSNLARTANIAIFPLRYNAKVTMLVGKALAAQPAPAQIGIMKGLSDFHHWFNSTEGQQWAAKNSEAIGLFNYYTPINSIGSFYSAITDGNPQDLGTLGGLPFGFISRVLQGQGIGQQQPYVNPKTGQISPNKVPETALAHAQQALQDIIGTFFSFPGRQAGFNTSKSSLITSLVPGLKISPKDEATQPTGPLSPSQKRIQAALGTSDKAPVSTAAPAVLRGNVRAPQKLSIASPDGGKKKKVKAKAIRPSNSLGY